MAIPKTFHQEGGTGVYLMNNLKSGQKVKFRVLSEFITGRMVWGEKDGKPYPYRHREGEQISPNEIGTNKLIGGFNRITQFLAAVVYNYTSSQVEILEVSKPTIIAQLVEIEENEDWGDSTGYDLTISKSGEGMETRYTLLPSNKGKFKIAVEWKHVNLEALYEGGDPFTKEKEEVSSSEEVAGDVPF